MNGKINPSQLVVSNFWFRPRDVKWIEWHITRSISGDVVTNLCLDDGKKIVFNSKDINYREDMEKLMWLCHSNNWISPEDRLDAKTLPEQ